MALRPTDSLAVLDALAPDPGWEVSLALVATYSVDLVAAAALVMALGGEGRDHEAMGHAGLARACEQLRDRVRIVCQGGRVSVPPKASRKALVLADRWIREVPRDGNRDSWHPKLALVRYAEVDDPGSVHWRLWLGSRNLTRDTSWDAAITAVGRPGKARRISRSIAHAGAVLARHAELPEASAPSIEQELAQLRWAWPEDVIDVHRFALWEGGAPEAALPRAPKGTTALVAVSPFADGTTLATLGRRAPHERSLLTTRATLDRVGGQEQRPLQGFEGRLYVLQGADHDVPLTHEDHDDQMVLVERGLHAKLLLFRGETTDRLWLGSANLTQRAWGGGNAEVMAELEVMKAVGDSLANDFLGTAQTPTHDWVPAGTTEDPTEALLDQARNRLAACWADAKLRVVGSRLQLDLGQAPPLRDPRLSLSARLLSAPDDVLWPADQAVLELPQPPLHQQTELVVLTLRTTEAPIRHVRWVARAPRDPAPSLERDRAVLSRLMGPGAFLAWLRSLLQEITGDEGDRRWPPPPSGNPGGAGATTQSLPTPSLEAILRTWARDPDAVHRVDRAVHTWSAQIREAWRHEDGDELALEQLTTFETHWAVLRRGLDLPELAP